MSQNENYVKIKVHGRACQHCDTLSPLGQVRLRAKVSCIQHRRSLGHEASKSYFDRGRLHLSHVTLLITLRRAQVVVRFTLPKVPLLSPSGYCLDMEVVNYRSQLLQDVLRDLNRCSFCHAGSFGRRRMGGARKRIGVRRRRGVVRRGYSCI